MIIGMLNIAQGFSGQTPTAFWETATVYLTTTSAIFGFIGVVFSLWEDERKSLKITDRVFSIIGAVVGVLAALSLLQYTQYNRIDERAANAEIQQSAQDAKTAIAGLKDEKQALVETNQQLISTSRAAKQSIRRLNAALEQANHVTALQVLITKMNADDAEAFDQLRGIKHFDNPEQEKMVKEAIQNVIGSHNAQGYLGASSLPWRYAPGDDEAVQMLSSKDATARKSGLRCLLTRHYVSKAGPILIRMAATDPSLDARTLATEVFNRWGNDHFTALDSAQMSPWWGSNGAGKD
jgi:hypothetical protein